MASYRKYILSFLLFHIVICSFADNMEDALLVTYKNESGDVVSTSILLTENPQVSFNQKNVCISVKDLAISYDKIVKLTFIQESTTSIGQSIDHAHNLTLRFVDENTIALVGITNPTSVIVCSVDGKRVKLPILWGNGEVIMQTDGLSRGIYIINALKQSFKIIRK